MKNYNKFVSNIKETYKNKLIALFLLAAGILEVIMVQDATFLVFIAMFAIPLFLAKKNWVYTPED
jgi:hypothetical protein